MRRRAELSGLPVIVVDSGESVGRVKDAVFDLGRGRLRGLLVAMPGGERFLPFDQVHSLGPAAVTVGAETRLLSAGSSAAPDGSGGGPSHEDADAPPLGKRVLTREGRMLGYVDDVIFDPESGAVWGYELTTGLLADFVDGRKTLPLTEGLVVGPDSVVVDQIDWTRDQSGAPGPGGTLE